MWELDCEESWMLKNWCFWTVVLEKTLESPLDCREIQPVHPKGDQSWVFIGRTRAEAETPILWPPHAKSWHIGISYKYTYIPSLPPLPPYFIFVIIFIILRTQRICQGWLQLSGVWRKDLSSKYPLIYPFSALIWRPYLFFSRSGIKKWWKMQNFCLFHFKKYIWVSSVTQSCPTLRPHEPQHARPPCL